MLCICLYSRFSFCSLHALRSLVLPCVLVSAVFCHWVYCSKLFLIACLIIPHCLGYLNPSMSLLLWSIVMCFPSYFPAFTSLISWFEPCTLTSDFWFCLLFDFEPLLLDFLWLFDDWLWITLLLCCCDWTDFLTPCLWSPLRFGFPPLKLDFSTLFTDYHFVTGITALLWSATVIKFFVWLRKIKINALFISSGCSLLPSTLSEDHVGFHVCQPRTKSWFCSRHRLNKCGQYDWKNVT